MSSIMVYHDGCTSTHKQRLGRVGEFHPSREDWHDTYAGDHESGCACQCGLGVRTGPGAKATPTRSTAAPTGLGSTMGATSTVSCDLERYGDMDTSY